MVRSFRTNIFQDHVDMLKDSEVSDVDYQWDLLHPGDCIFIPAQYMHQVLYLNAIYFPNLFSVKINCTSEWYVHFAQPTKIITCDCFE